MKLDELSQRIIDLCNEVASFKDKVDRLQGAVNASTTGEILEQLDYAGVIPERFSHDSTEEKLFAKYCDALLARALREIGLEAESIAERADAADVQAKGADYSLVADAKAFRLSRTAKNQKDFKVEALNQWRKGADYACLIAPIYQYPRANSQIYSQALRFNVTLLSYTHLAFIIRHKPEETGNLKKLWQLGNVLQPSSNALEYWQIVDSETVRICVCEPAAWKDAKHESYKRLPEQATAEIRYLEAEKQRVEGLTHDLAVQMLIKEMKLNEKIAAIVKTVRSRL